MTFRPLTLDSGWGQVLDPVGALTSDGEETRPDTLDVVPSPTLPTGDFRIVSG